MNPYQLTEKVEKKYKSEIIKYISNVEKNGQIDALELTGSELSPYTLGTLLENLGYKKDDIDTNGWEWDFWIKYIKEGSKSLCIFGTGITFELNLSYREED